MKTNLFLLFLLGSLSVYAQTDTEKYFIEAIKSNNIEKVKDYIYSGYNPLSSYQSTTLGENEYCRNVRKQSIPYFFVAVKNGDVNMIKFFIDKGANVNAFITDEFKGHWERGKWIVDETIDISALDVAICRQDGQIIDLLLKNGANPNKCLDRIVETYCSVGNLKYFEKNGAKFNFDNKMLQQAIKNNDPKCVKYILDHGAVGDAKSLIEAVAKGNFDICEMLLTHGSDINASNDGYYPICQAVRSGKLPMVKYLVNRGADINVSCTYWVSSVTKETVSLFKTASDPSDLNKQPEIAEFLLLAPGYLNRRRDEIQQTNALIAQADNQLKSADTITAVQSFKSAYLISADTSINGLVDKYFKKSVNALIAENKYNQAASLYDLAYRATQKIEFKEEAGQTCYKGKLYKRAVIEYTEVINSNSKLSNETYYKRGFNYCMCGNFKAGLDDLKKYESLGLSNEISKAVIAWAYAGLGDKINTLEQIKIAAQKHQYIFTLVDVEPAFNFIKETPEFLEIIKNYKK